MFNPQVRHSLDTISGNDGRDNIDLMCEKMLSNQLLTGQEVGVRSPPMMLVIPTSGRKPTTKRCQTQAGRENISTSQNDMNASPLDSPTGNSPKVMPFSTLVEGLSLHSFTNRIPDKRKRKAVSPRANDDSTMTNITPVDQGNIC